MSLTKLTTNSNPDTHNPPRCSVHQLDYDVLIEPGFVCLLGTTHCLCHSLYHLFAAPGEIRTPSLVVRSHALENAFHTMIYDTIVQRLSQIILSFKEFPAYNGSIPYLIWDDKGVTTVGFSL